MVSRIQRTFQKGHQRQETAGHILTTQLPPKMEAMDLNSGTVLPPPHPSLNHLCPLAAVMQSIRGIAKCIADSRLRPHAGTVPVIGGAWHPVVVCARVVSPAAYWWSPSRVTARRVALQPSASWTPLRALTSVAGKSHYERLGIMPPSTPKEIKTAYLKRAKECHPDLHGAGKTAEFQALTGAYAVLSDPQRKAAYDMGGCREASSSMDDVHSSYEIFRQAWSESAAAEYFDMIQRDASASFRTARDTSSMVYVHTRIRSSTHARAHTCICVRVHLKHPRMYGCMHMCVCACVCVYVRACACT